MKTQRGFNLVELLVVVAIIGILASIGYLPYKGYTKMARATAAKQFMMDLSNAEESYRNDTMRYVAYTGPFPGTLNLGVPTEIQPYYHFTVVTNTPWTTYVIMATPIGSQVGEQVLTLNQAGAKNW